MNKMQPTQAEQTVEDRSTEFQPVQGGGETSSAGGLLTAAYVLMWLAVFGFVWLTAKRVKSLDQRLNELDAALKKADAASSGGPEERS
jgi:CcmD family protein